MAVDDEKLKAEREARRKLFMDWDIEKELPADISGYKLHRIDKQDGRIYYAFGWTNEENGWEVRALFDEETMDYMVKMYLRLVTLTEIELITGDFDEFKRNLVLLTPKAIDHELIHRENVSVFVRGKGFMVWDSEPFLPETIGHYQRMIKPSMPVLGLNGSYIIGAYECREKDTGILFFYNMYRDEYYGELRAGSLEAFKQDVYTPEYATGFKIMGADNTASTLIQVSNPWQGAKDVKMSYFISRNGEQAPAGFTGPTIPAGAKRIVCMASSYIAMFDALGQVDRIIGVSGIDYVSNPYILAHKDSIKDMGPEMNYELLLGLKPDVVLLYGIGDAQTAVTDKLKELFIPYMYVGEYLEESPLGKAEWLVALAELTDSREKGIEIFREIPKRYQVLKALTESVEQRPTVMLNTPWNDSWVMPSTQSYMAQLVTDAGADYIYKENNSNSSTPIGLETAYKLIQKADYWINVGMASTLDELKTVNPKFVDAKAVREKTVYNNNLRTTPTGGNDYWESAVVRPDVVLRDLIHIFHPELVSDSLYYYRHLE